ncbi:hypothetical protein DFH11DRAFT_1735668 [Phellopilus nigrolimitatus]|nr:hypothetical protein DFH11DRAFT_1735668 [Phellopilus nigrolimitatus]
MSERPTVPLPSWASSRDKTPPPQPPAPSSSSDAAASNVNDFGHLPHTFDSQSPLKNKTYVKTRYAGSQSPDIQKEKRDDIGTSVRDEVMDATFRNIPGLVSVSFPDRAFNVTTGLSVEHVRYPEAEADVENNHANAESNEGASGDDELQSSMADGDATHVRDTSPPTPAPSTPATSPDGPRRSARLQHMASKANLARDCIDPLKKVLEHLKGKCLYRDGKWVNWPVTGKPGAEPHIVTYFNKVVDEARSFLDPAYKKSSNDRVFSDRYREIALNSTTAERKPDIVVLSREDAEREEKGSWAGVYGFGELKSNPTFPLNMVEVQGAQYARLCYSHQEDRRFVVSFCLFDDDMELYVFNRAGIRVSTRFNVHSSPEDFLRVIIGFLVSEEYYIGFDPSFFTDTRPSKPAMSTSAASSSSEPGKASPPEAPLVNAPEATAAGPSMAPPANPSTKSKKPLTRAATKRLCVKMNGKLYRILETIHVDPVICGRGTVCFMVQGEGDDYVSVLKDSWVDRSRPLKESEVLQDIKTIDGVSRFVDHEIVHFSINGQIIKDTTDSDLLDDEDVVIRDHHRLLITPYGKGLEDFDSLTELVSAFKDYVLVIKALHEKKIVHRDISPRNLILVKIKELLLRKGVVIDFDYAIKQPRTGCAKGERTGTLPFMSIDMLMGRIEKHCYYHDLESLLYVLVWVCTTQGGPHDAPRAAADCAFNDTGIAAWCGLSPAAVNPLDREAMKSVGQRKISMMTVENEYETEIISRVHHYFKPLFPLMREWRGILYPSKPHPHVLAMLGGIIPEPVRLPRDREAENVFADLIKAIDSTLLELKSNYSAPPPPVEVSAGKSFKDVIPPSLQTRYLLRSSKAVNEGPAPNKTDTSPYARQAMTSGMQSSGTKRGPDHEEIVDNAASHSSKPSKRLRSSDSKV